MPREATEKVQNAEIGVKDVTCFVRNYAQRHTICDALTGVVITPLMMFVEIIILVYTMVSVGCSNFIPSEKTDRMRALINSIIWFSSIIVVCYLLWTWEMSWMNFDFTPHTPIQWLIALALLLVGLASIGLELFFEEKLYMSVKTVSQSDTDFTVNEKDGIEMPVRTIRSSIHARYAEISETIPAREQQISYNSALC
ncbi:unnamed protein product [Toxocara canis]|uniref:Transmembrane protein n=1 Tax=Toxocara canis TaxID=6265 RepID=A0A183UAV0_TOXCA|nr:unnamed protein product [Toxocara canis]